MSFSTAHGQRGEEKVNMVQVIASRKQRQHRYLIVSFSFGTGKKLNKHTGSFPLVLIHCTSSILIHDFHANEQRFEFRVFLMFLKDLVEFFFVEQSKPIFRSQSRWRCSQR